MDLTTCGTPVMASGARAAARCRTIAVSPYSDSADGLYRGYLTPAYAATQALVAEWMRDAGMVVHLDAAANLVGSYAGETDCPPLIIGSHLDSVRDAGAYDGPLGIVLGIECVAALNAEGRHLPFPVEVYAFGDEEGSRFPVAMTTSRAVVGQGDPASLDLTDAEGVQLGDALAAHLAGTVPVEAWHGPALAYLEAHIEQGPVLEARGAAVGTVTAIAAQKRFACTVKGMAGHAGTTVMELRQDALTAAAAMILAIENIAREGAADLVATVGQIEALPGAANVVPGAVRFTIDVRAGTDAVRDSGAEAILAACKGIAIGRGISFAADLVQDLPASLSDAALMDLMDASIAATGALPLRLVSGAGHDAMILNALCPTAMLFIRCSAGISHNPAEHVDDADVEVALDVMRGFIDQLAVREAFVARHAELFEHSPWVVERAAARLPFADLHAGLMQVVAEASEAEQLALIRAHPELGGRAMLTKASTDEQASAGLDRLDEGEVARLDAFNACYRERFGFPFVICVRLVDKAGIFAAMETRLTNDRATEIATALAEIGRIVALRLEAVA